MEKVLIMGVKIGDRVNSSKKVQEILTQYGCSIKTRLGIHSAGNECARAGLIILELVGDTSSWEKLKKELLEVVGVEVKDMDFDL